MISNIFQLLSEFGYPVAFTLLMVYLFVKFDDKASKERREDKELHRSERAEWREAQTRLQSDTNDAIKELTRVIERTTLK